MYYINKVKINEMNMQKQELITKFSENQIKLKWEKCFSFCSKYIFWSKKLLRLLNENKEPAVTTKRIITLSYTT